MRLFLYISWHSDQNHSYFDIAIGEIEN